MASFRKRNGKWQVQIRRSQGEPVSRSFVLKSDAEIWARQIEAEIDRSVLPVGVALSKFRLADLLNRYLQEITPNKRAFKNEAYVINGFLRSPLASLGLTHVTPQAISEYRDLRLSQVQPASVRRELDVLGHVLETAKSNWLLPLPANPVRVIRKPAPPEARKRRLTREEYERLVEVCAKLTNQNMAKLFLFAIETGMRRGEIIGLLWENVRLDTGTAYLPMTKNGSSRTVPLSPKAKAILASLFPKENGNVFDVSAVAVRQAWERIRIKAGIADVHFHDLRHEAISRFFEMGLSVPEVALISGHKDMRMLFRYTHLKAENVAEKMEALR